MYERIFNRKGVGGRTWGLIFIVNSIMVVQSSCCFWYRFEFFSVFLLSTKTFTQFEHRKFPFSEGMEKPSERLAYKIFIFNRSIVRNPHDFLSPLFILLCLTTIHHNINRKLFYIYIQHETYFIRQPFCLFFPSLSLSLSLSPAPFVVEIWIFIDIFDEDSRSLWLRLSMSPWNIIEISFYSVVFKASSLCVLTCHVVSAEYGRWHWEREWEWKKNRKRTEILCRQILSSIYLVSRKKTHGLFKHDIFFFSTLNIHVYSSDWLDWE